MFNIATKKRLKLSKHHVRNLASSEADAVAGGRAPPPGRLYPVQGTSQVINWTNNFWSFNCATVNSNPSVCLCVELPPPPPLPQLTGGNCWPAGCNGPQATQENTRVGTCTQ